MALTDRQRLIVGIDALREEGENRETFGNTTVYRESRNNTGLYAGWQANAGAFDSEISLRADDNSVFGNHATGSAAAGWRFNDATRAYASYGEGFRGPTLNELYSPGFGGLFAGNPELEPEESRSAEIGFEFLPSADQRLKFNLHSTRVRNLISFSGVDFQAVNIARAEIKGAEIDYRMSAGAWQFSANYTWQDPRNADTDSALLRRPKQKAASTIERSFGDALHLGAEVIASGPRDDVGGIDLPGYALVNVRASWKLSPQWQFLARIENLADRDYELAYGYNTPGRSGFLEIVWTGH
jgi:vitamin B12 transporter